MNLGNILLETAKQLQTERGIDQQTLLSALETALLSAYKKKYGTTANTTVKISTEDGSIVIATEKKVVTEVTDPSVEISKHEAKAINPKAKVNDTVVIESSPKDLGRLAAQAAKQVIMQQIREAERKNVYEEYHNKEGKILTASILRVEGNMVILSIGRVETVLFPRDQVQGEYYKAGNPIKVYLAEVKESSKGPQLKVSRSHPGIVKALFEREIPEIQDGTVQIKAVAREGGSRSKIAVYSKLSEVDAVGACIGQHGSRIRAILNELSNEKIDIIEWQEDPEKFIIEALKPAKILWVRTRWSEKTARVMVADSQLSLAIGRSGQNVRLAAKLTGWKIDIKGESTADDEFKREDFEEKYVPPLMEIPEMAEEAVQVEAPVEVPSVEPTVVPPTPKEEKAKEIEAPLKEKKKEKKVLEKVEEERLDKAAPKKKGTKAAKAWKRLQLDEEDFEEELVEEALTSEEEEEEGSVTKPLKEEPSAAKSALAEKLLKAMEKTEKKKKK